MLAAVRDIERQGRAQSATDTLAGAGRGLADEGARVRLVACSGFSIASDTLGCASSSRRLVPWDGRM
jgi:hypothetical protein